ncbi:MAG: hypothetical protein ACJ718_10430 [Nitrososphaeraceae archaeon]|jgi:hypothetical protein
MSSLACRLCGNPIKFDDKWVSERTGKKIPLDPGTNEPNDCPVRRDHLQQQQQGQQLQQPNSSKKKGDIINVTKVAASKFSG